MRQTVIVDLDGTLADVGHRCHLVSGAKRDYTPDVALDDRQPCGPCLRPDGPAWPAERHALVTNR